MPPQAVFVDKGLLITLQLFTAAFLLEELYRVPTDVSESFKCECQEPQQKHRGGKL